MRLALKAILSLVLASAPAVAQQKYPGWSCDVVLDQTVRFARDIRLGEDRLSNSIRHLKAKEAAGDAKGVEGEKEYMARVMDRMPAQYSALGGAISSAQALRCEPSRIEAAVRCGLERLGEKCN